MEPIPAASFGKSHIALIGVSIVLLVAATFMSGGLKLSSFSFSSAQSAPKGLTLAEAQAQAHQIIAERNGTGTGDSTALAAQNQEQLAEVDPSYGKGSVLGASTDSSADVDQVLNSDAIASLPISSYQTSDPLQFNGYARSVHAVESKYGADVLLGALTTRDQASLQAAAAAYKNIIAGLLEVKVPSQFIEYHRMKLVYYSALAGMASSMATDGADDQTAAAASLFFTLNDKLQALQTQLESQYEVIL
jgi:hypothetical protein